MKTSELHKYLRNIRIENNELLKNMADKLGLQPSELSAIEHQRKTMPEGFMEMIHQLYGPKHQKGSMHETQN